MWEGLFCINKRISKCYCGMHFSVKNTSSKLSKLFLESSVSVLFNLAIFFNIFSASIHLPLDSSHRGDSINILCVQKQKNIFQTFIFAKRTILNYPFLITFLPENSVVNMGLWSSSIIINHMSITMTSIVITSPSSLSMSLTSAFTL